MSALLKDSDRAPLYDATRESLLWHNESLTLCGMQLWDLTSGLLSCTAPYHVGGVNAVTFSPTPGDYFASGGGLPCAQ